MLEVTGNIWDYPADAICITTNLVVTGKGLIMGAGLAKQARDRYPSLAPIFGDRYKGFSLTSLRDDHFYAQDVRVADGKIIIAFPTKYNWRDKSDLLLIRRSATDLVYLVEKLEDDLGKDIVVVLPRPGCGLGGLEWNRVKTILDPILFGDQFRIITPN